MGESLIADKSYQFALKIVELYKRIVSEKKEYVLSKQLLKSGTSIGANVEEGLGGQSKKDFFTKMCIAYKEARETHYWLRLLTDSKLIEPEESKPLSMDCNEILKILESIKKSTLRGIKS